MTETGNTRAQSMFQATAVPQNAALSARRDTLQLARIAMLIVLIAGAIAGLITAFGVMPSLIRSAYEGTGAHFLDGAFDHKDEHPLSFYLSKWYKLAGGAMVAWVGFWSLALITTSRRFAEHLVGSATPGRLGAIRVFTCLIMMRMAWGDNVYSVIHLPDTQRKSMGIMNWFYGYVPGFAEMVHNAPALTAFKALTLAALFFAMIGWRTRLMLAVGVAMYLPLVGIQRSFYWFNHSGLIPSYVAVVLCFTRSGDGWSVDRLLKLWRGEAVPAKDETRPYYAWAIYAVWIVIAMPYVLAGLSKLFNNSVWWWTAVNMQNILFTDALRPGMDTNGLIRFLTALPPWVYTLMGAATIVTEVGMGAVLFSRIARFIMPPITLGMHVGIELLQRILFLDLILIQAVFYNWAKVRRWVGRKWASFRGGKLEVLYDDRCTMCQRSVRVLTSLDLFERLEFVDLHGLDLASYRQGTGVALSHAELNEAMHVVWKGRAYRGFDGIRKIAAALPLLWTMAPLMYLPGIPQLGRRRYRAIAARRMTMHQCAGGTCAVASPLSTATPTAVNPATLPLWRRLLGPAVVACLIAFLLACWSVRLEYYPFTSMQMFSTYDDSGVVSYYRVEKVLENGIVNEAKLEHMGFGASRYRPILQNSFKKYGRETCIDMLIRCGNFWNQRMPHGQRVVRLEVHKRDWNFVENRHDRDFGSVVDKIIVEFDPATGKAAEQLARSAE